MQNLCPIRVLSMACGWRVCGALVGWWVGVRAVGEGGGGATRRHHALRGRSWQFGTTPLYRAVEREHLEIATFLLDRGADINTPDKVRFFPPAHPPPPARVRVCSVRAWRARCCGSISHGVVMGMDWAWMVPIAPWRFLMWKPLSWRLPHADD